MLKNYFIDRPEVYKRTSPTLILHLQDFFGMVIHGGFVEVKPFVVHDGCSLSCLGHRRLELVTEFLQFPLKEFDQLKTFLLRQEIQFLIGVSFNELVVSLIPLFQHSLFAWKHPVLSMSGFGKHCDRGHNLKTLTWILFCFRNNSP